MASLNINFENVLSAVDFDNDGKLSLNEMYKGFYSLGVFCTVCWSIVESVILTAIGGMAKDGNNLVSLSSFTRWARQVEEEGEDKNKTTPIMSQERTVMVLRQAILMAERDRGISVEKVRIEELPLLFR